MIVNKTSSVEEYQISSRFDSLRKILKTKEYSRHLQKPLAYWALPTDRRLPLVLLGRTLGDLLEMSFTELTATPGIGQKKIRSFVGLLSRAANTDSTDLSVDDIKLSGNGSTRREDETGTDEFDPSAVSEVVWSKWRATVLKHGFRIRDAGSIGSQPARHDPSQLEHTLGRIHGPHLGRDQSPKNARRKTHPCHAGSLPRSAQFAL